MSYVARFPHCEPLIDFWSKLRPNSMFEFRGVPWGKAILPLTLLLPLPLFSLLQQLAVFPPYSYLRVFPSCASGCLFFNTMLNPSFLNIFFLCHSG